MPLSLVPGQDGTAVKTGGEALVVRQMLFLWIELHLLIILTRRAPFYQTQTT